MVSREEGWHSTAALACSFGYRCLNRLPVCRNGRSIVLGEGIDGSATFLPLSEQHRVFVLQKEIVQLAFKFQSKMQAFASRHHSLAQGFGERLIRLGHSS